MQNHKYVFLTTNFLDLRHCVHSYRCSKMPCGLDGSSGSWSFWWPCNYHFESELTKSWKSITHEWNLLKKKEKKKNNWTLYLKHASHATSLLENITVHGQSGLVTAVSGLPEWLTCGEKLANSKKCDVEIPRSNNNWICWKGKERELFWNSCKKQSQIVRHESHLWIHEKTRAAINYHFKFDNYTTEHVFYLL